MAYSAVNSHLDESMVKRTLVRSILIVSHFIAFWGALFWGLCTVALVLGGPVELHLGIVVDDGSPEGRFFLWTMVPYIFLLCLGILVRESRLRRRADWHERDRGTVTR